MAVASKPGADLSAIQRLIRRARFRIRTQWALEGATTAAILAAAAALSAMFAIRLEWVTLGTGVYLLIGAASIIVLGAVVSASRRIDDETVARRIDRASDLSDRLSTAIAFERALTLGQPIEASLGSAEARSNAERCEESIDHETTEALMAAAIADGLRAAPRAKVKAAAPFAMPRDWRAALGFITISALAAGLALPMPDRSPKLFGVEPDHAPPGAEVLIRGDNLMVGVTSPLASLETATSVIGTPNATTAPVQRHGFVPTDAYVYLGPSDKARPVTVLDWTGKTILIQIPVDAPLGDTLLTAYIDGKAVGPLAFTVIDKHDPNYFSEKAVILDPDERQIVDDVLARLKEIAKRDNIDDLDQFAKQIEQLLADAQEGKITKEQLLDALAKAEDALNKDAEPNEAEIQKQMAEMGKELAKDKITKELGEALEKNDLDKAKQELEKLAEKIDKKEMSDKDKEELSKELDKVAKQMEKQDKDKQDKQDKQQQKVEDEIRRLEKEKKDAKNDKERLDAERRLEKKKDELKKLQKDQDQKEQSDQRQALKRLQRDMEKAAENLQKPQKQDGNKEEQEQRDQQASQKLKDAARETGRVDKDQRKQAAQKKTSSQMDDLREAMRRAKQKGNKGPQDPFGRNGRNQDFLARAKGQKGNGQGWKPGQGQGQQQQGTNQPGGQGNQPGGKEWGVGHDDNMTADPTQKTGNDKEQELQGKVGKEGTSTRETILAAAQKGFASAQYKKVYANYEKIVEDVMRNEKLPSSYKYYVKRYFAKIHPKMEEAPNP
jgi:hypothetical protein